MAIDLPLVYSGKVRDVYDAGAGKILLVASDRMSAFDVVMAEPIPNKGRVLTAMSAFWFEHFGDSIRSRLPTSRGRQSQPHDAKAFATPV